jgi:flagellar biosynthesis protein FlhG
LLDLGAGTSFNTLDFFLISQNGIFITTPEPTSIENVYRLVRAIYFRHIRHCFDAFYFKELEKEVVLQFGDASINKPSCMMQVVSRLHPELFIRLEDTVNSFKFKLILNQLRKQDNVDIGVQICQIIEKHLGLHIEFAGNVSYDDHIHDAICQRSSFLDRYPHARAATDLRELSKQMVNSAGTQLLMRYS